MGNKKKPGDTPEKEQHIYTIQKTAAGDPLPIDPETGNIDEKKLTPAQREELQESMRGISDALNNQYEKLQESMRGVSDAINKFVDSNIIDELANTISETLNNVFTADFSEIVQQLQPAIDLENEITELEPFLRAELKKDEYNGLTFDDILNDNTLGELLAQAQDETSLIYRALTAARTAKETEKSVVAQRTDNVEFPLDKINSNAWKRFAEDYGDGQLSISFDMFPKKPNLQAITQFSINFDNLGDDLKITKRLQPFDKQVYVAVSAIYNAGNDITTATQIYYAMGYTGSPAPNQIKKIDDSLSKMLGATITIDNIQEHTALKGKEKYPHFEYSGPLLPIERMTAKVNGQVAESAIHILSEPRLMTFAKQRKQVTTIDIALLQSPISKTDANLMIQDYLIERISHEKNKKTKTCRILFSTLFEKTQITTKKQRQRAPEKIETYLTHFQKKGLIKKYTMQTDGITIFW